jgi:hypothetical protein
MSASVDTVDSRRRALTVGGLRSRDDINALRAEVDARHRAAIRDADAEGREARFGCEDVEATAKRRELDFIYIGPPKGRVAAVLYPPRRYYGRAPRPERRPARTRGSRRGSSSPNSRGDPDEGDEAGPPARRRLVELVRDDPDRRPVPTVTHRGRLEVVGTAWLDDALPPPGTYRIECGAARLEIYHTGRRGSR